MRDFSFLPPDARAAAEAERDSVTEIRLRRKCPVTLRFLDGRTCAFAGMSSEEFGACVSYLMEYSLYARQTELDRGYFTLPDGSRAGVCGTFAGGSLSSVAQISSLCLRIAREIPGCADPVLERFPEHGGFLAVSPPGMGKTTLLRDLARQLSDRGKAVCVIDERGELAACRDGVPTLDVGALTDVIGSLPRYRAMGIAVRACAPQILVTDEIGDMRDAGAAMEASRCGVYLAASVHGNSLREAELPGAARAMIRSGMFARAVLLGPRPGRIAAWKDF